MTGVADVQWIDIGAAETLANRAVQPIRAGRHRLALTCAEGVFGAVSARCNHVGGPLDAGHLEGEYLTCPWHQWKFHRCTGAGEPGYEADRVPSHAVRIEAGRVLVSAEPVTKRGHLPKPVDPLAREPIRAAGPIRVVGLSTTSTPRGAGRYSTSEALLELALAHARESLGAETTLVRLRDLAFRHCEGYYSISARACTWPCSITQADADDQMRVVYEAVVHTADVVLVATPIRWGAASSLYFKMVERMNCVQNQVTIANRRLIRRKVAAFIVTGGQDNVQAVIGQQLAFFSEIGFVFPPFPFVAHSLGWDAEDMERNVAHVRESAALHEGTRALAARAVALAREQLDAEEAPPLPRGGRKAHPLAASAPGDDDGATTDVVAPRA